MSAGMFPRLVLFDLDGTLLDSAPDMVATVNRMRAARAQAPMQLAELRPHVSRGSRAMSAAAFPELGGDVPAEMIREFLDTYEQELGRSSVLFESWNLVIDARAACTDGRFAEALASYEAVDLKLLGPSSIENSEALAELEAE